MTHDMWASVHDHRTGVVGSAVAPGDRPIDSILITLLALNLILLAFFVVLNATSTFDADRVRAVAASARATFLDDRAETEKLSYRGALSGFRDSIADQFALVSSPELGTNNRTDIRMGDDRIEVVVPASVFFRDNGALYSPLPTLDGIAAVMSSPPLGYRAELAVSVTALNTDLNFMMEQISVLADSLVARGISATVLSAGLLSKPVLERTRGEYIPLLRFSFFLMKTYDDKSQAVRLSILAPEHGG